MMKLKVEKHIHKYRRMGIGNQEQYLVYKCIDNCTHYLPLHQAIGRISKCNTKGCDGTAEITYHMIHFAKTVSPICDNCKEKKKLFKLNNKDVELIEENEKLTSEKPRNNEKEPSEEALNKLYKDLGLL